MNEPPWKFRRLSRMTLIMPAPAKIIAICGHPKGTCTASKMAPSMHRVPRRSCQPHTKFEAYCSPCSAPTYLQCVGHPGNEETKANRRSGHSSTSQDCHTSRTNCSRDRRRLGRMDL